MQEKIRNPSIVWQKWKDPFNDVAMHISPEDFIQSPEFVNDLGDDAHDSDEVYDMDDTEKNQDIVPKKYTKAIMTPFGIVPYDDQHSVSASFNFWIGHTNFNLSPKIVTIIENSEGVEILDVYTRYRFRIGIGQLFHAGDVMSMINKCVYKYLDDGYHE